MSKICMIIGITLLVLFITSNGVFAQINQSYNLGKEVIEEDIDQKVQDSVILDGLATLVYAVASLVELILGWIFKLMTGSNVFPWADRVIFNSLPLLDVNFFNPSQGSLFLSGSGKATALSDIIRSTYFTILALAVAFLSIVVAVSAIKLALSSLASEKAKYKDALTKWLFSIVMLFLMHNLMSFVFFINEKMVEVASSMLNGKITQANIDLINENLSIDSGTAIENFVEANDGAFDNNDEKAFIKTNSNIAYRLLESSNYQNTVLAKAYEDASHGFRNWIRNAFTKNGSQVLDAIIKDITFIKEGETTVTVNGESKYITILKNKEENNISLEEYIDSKNSLINNPGEVSKHRVFQYYNNLIDGINDGNAQENSFKWAEAIISVYKSVNNQNVASDKPDLMASLAQYFKESAYTVPTDDQGNVTGWKRSNLTIQGALLYAIFVFQSLFFFFSYLKRFFYIVILAVMAPAIVILDFLGKSLM